MISMMSEKNDNKLYGVTGASPGRRVRAEVVVSQLRSVDGGSDPVALSALHLPLCLLRTVPLH